MGQGAALKDSEQRLRALAVVLAHARGKLEQRTERSDDLVVRPVGHNSVARHYEARRRALGTNAAHG